MDIYRVTVELSMDIMASSVENAESIMWDNIKSNLDDAKANSTNKVTCKKIESDLSKLKESYSNILTEMVLDKENNSLEDILLVAIRAKHEIDRLKEN